MNRRGSNLSSILGLGSLLISLGFYFCVYFDVDVSYPYDLAALIVAFGGASLLALIAAWRGSRWWLLALLGPLVNAMFILSLQE